MKLNEIKVGKTYHNGKSAVRKVIGEYYPTHYLDQDCVRYAVLAGRNTGAESYCTRRAFAAWAKGYGVTRLPEKGTP